MITSVDEYEAELARLRLELAECRQAGTTSIDHDNPALAALHRVTRENVAEGNVITAVEQEN